MSYLDSAAPRQRAKLVVETVQAVAASGDLELVSPRLRDSLTRAATVLADFDALGDGEMVDVLTDAENALDELRKILTEHTPPTRPLRAR